MRQENKDSAIIQSGVVGFDDSGAAIDLRTGKPALVCRDGQLRTATDTGGDTDEFLEAYASVVLTTRAAP